MSNGISRMWEEIAEQQVKRRQDLFQSNKPVHYERVAEALEKLERLSGLDLSLTKWQHQLMDDSISALKDCFKETQ